MNKKKQNLNSNNPNIKGKTKQSSPVTVHNLNLSSNQKMDIRVGFMKLGI